MIHAQVYFLTLFLKIQEMLFKVFGKRINFPESIVNCLIGGIDDAAAAVKCDYLNL